VGGPVFHAQRGSGLYERATLTLSLGSFGGLSASLVFNHPLTVSPASLKSHGMTSTSFEIIMLTLSTRSNNPDSATVPSTVIQREIHERA